MIKANLPELTRVYNEAMKKESDQQAKKPAQKETISPKEEKKAT